MGLKPRLRKAYVAAKLSDYAGRQTRARRSVAKEAWAKPFCPFGAQTFLMSGADSKVWRLNLMLTRMGSCRIR